MKVSRLMDTPIYRLYGCLMCLDEKLVTALVLNTNARNGLLARRLHVLAILQSRWDAKQFNGTRRPPFLGKTGDLYAGD